MTDAYSRPIVDQGAARGRCAAAGPQRADDTVVLPRPAGAGARLARRVAAPAAGVWSRDLRFMLVVLAAIVVLFLAFALLIAFSPTGAAISALAVIAAPIATMVAAYYGISLALTPGERRAERRGGRRGTCAGGRGERAGVRRVGGADGVGPAGRRREAARRGRARPATSSAPRARPTSSSDPTGDWPTTARRGIRIGRRRSGAQSSASSETGRSMQRATKVRKRRRLGAVAHPVVERDRELGDRAHRELAVDDPRSLARAARCRASPPRGG